MQEITITNIEKIGNNQYNVFFSKNFTLTDLFYEISLNGTTFQSPVSLSSFTSPQVITVPNAINFNIRLSANYIAPTPPPPYSRIHTNVFTEPFN